MTGWQLLLVGVLSFLVGGTATYLQVLQMTRARRAGRLTASGEH